MSCHLHEAKLKALEAQVRELYRLMREPMLTPMLTLLAADAEHVAETCRTLQVSWHSARQRAIIIRKLREDGWTVGRISRVLMLSDRTVRAHLNKGRRKSR
jgi:DNA-binding NarL/FixJ family response regulator